MNDRLSPHVITADVTCTVANFTPNVYMQLGDTDSNHGVMFGNLDGYGDVAVKPHAKVQRARREAETLEIAIERGVLAVEPIMVAEGDLSNYLITKRKPDLHHLGQNDWAVLADSPTLVSVIEPALAVAAMSIATRHKHGLYKLDSQVKNIVVDKCCNPVHVDSEATLVNVPLEMRAKHGNLDLRNLGCSALYRGLLADQPQAERIEFLSKKLLDPYFDQINPDLFPLASADRKLAIRASYADYFDKRA